MDLNEIGFYTLSDKRIEQVSPRSPISRMEILITGRCNFRCPYCRGTDMGDILPSEFYNIFPFMGRYIKNIRLSGGEPTLHPHLLSFVKYARSMGCEHIAISTNGSADIGLYRHLIEAGVNDFSISLDACCASTGDMMAGNVKGAWKKVIENIKALSKLTYVTVGIVVTHENVEELPDIIGFAHGLGVADIRVISAAQLTDDNLIKNTIDIPQEIIDAHPILKYRLRNLLVGSNRLRGIEDGDSHACALVMDDVAIKDGYHYPCIIYLREGGEPIGSVRCDMRKERIHWFLIHNTHEDPICKKNCLDVCKDYNNKYRELRA